MAPKCSYFFSDISIPTNSTIIRTFSHIISKPLWQPLQTGPGSSFFPLESTQCPFASLIILKYFISRAYSSAQRSAMASCFQKWIKMPEVLWPSLPDHSSTFSFPCSPCYSSNIFIILTSVVCFISYSKPKPRPPPPGSLPNYWDWDWCTYCLGIAIQHWIRSWSTVSP